MNENRKNMTLYYILSEELWKNFQKIITDSKNLKYLSLKARYEMIELSDKETVTVVSGEVLVK